MIQGEAGGEVMPEKSAICWSNWHRHRRRSLSRLYQNFRILWLYETEHVERLTSHSLLRLLKNMPVFPLHTHTHTRARAHTNTHTHTHTHLTLTYWSILEKRGLRIMPYFYLKLRDISSLFGPCILLSTFFSDTFGASDFLNMINDLSERFEAKYRRV